MAERCKLYTGLGAMGNAVNPNPVVGMMDMALMVSITRELCTKPWATELFGRENAAVITAMLNTQEQSIWNIARDYLTPDQLQGLHGLTEQWIASNPDQRFVASARLAELSGPRRSGNNNNNHAVVNLAAGVFSLVSIDPFKGLDPAIQQVEQSRVLAERAFFYLQHMPTLLSW